MAKFNIVGNSDKFFRSLQKALEKGLSTARLKKEAEAAIKTEIEKAVTKSQDVFRPDRGPDGGDDLVGLLGIGAGGSPQKKKYSGGEAAWKLLEPGGISVFDTTFRRANRAKFGLVSYQIDIERFYNHFKSRYKSRKRGDEDLIINWMENLIEGIPTGQEREYPKGVTSYSFVTSGPNFNKNFSRTGLGIMVPSNRLKVPARQFEFSGRGRQATFGVLFENINKSLSSSRFKRTLESRIAKIINSGG